MKICSKCNKELDEKFFSKNKYGKNGLRSYCRMCNKLYNELNKNKHIEYNLNHKNEKLEYNKAYYKEKRKIVREQQKEYYEEHKKEKLKYNKKQYHEKMKKDFTYKIIHNARVRMRDALRGRNKSNSTIKLLGCSVEELRQHLEKQFKEGMSWNNYGYYGWHIDHIIPCAFFNLLNEEEQRKCFHYTNLQPLWMKDNIRKSDRLP